MDYYRIGMFSTFVRLARQNYSLMVQCEKRLKEYDEKKLKASDETEVYSIVYESLSTERKLDECIISTIIFSSLSLEGYIYDYAARNLGDSFTKEHLDKLDVISKWLIIPRLITGKQISKGEEAYFLLKSLINTRNSIVHNKSKKIDVENLDKVYIKNMENEMKYLSEAHSAIKTLDKLAEKIEEFDSNERAKFLLIHTNNYNSEFDEI